MSRGRPPDLVVADKKNTIHSVSILPAGVYADSHNPGCTGLFRRLSAAFRPEIRSILHSFPGHFPQFLLWLSTCFQHDFHTQFFIDFCGGFPHDLAD
jgi:hypothetical protein